MNNEIYTMLIFFIIGILIGILFDIFRTLRRTFKTSNIVTYIEDALFWILTGFLILYGILNFSLGEIRFYTILTIITGTIIYYLIISKYLMYINVKIINFIKKIAIYIIKPFKQLFASKYIKLKKNKKIQKK